MGVKQWVFQRVCNLIFVLFGLWLLVALISGQPTTLASLLADSTTQLFLAVVLVLAGLNSMLAGWQIAGDYAHKINVNSGILTGFAVVVSAAYILMGLSLLY